MALLAVLLASFALSNSFVSCIYEPFASSLLANADLSTDPCVDFVRFMCGATHDLTLFQRFGLRKPNALGPQCDYKIMFARTIETLDSKFNNYDLKKESTERMEFEFDKARWECESNAACYRKKFDEYNAFVSHVKPTSTLTLDEDADSFKIRDQLYSTLKIIDDTSILEFEAMKWLIALGSRRCSAYYMRYAKRTPYRLAKYYETLTRIYNSIFETIQNLLQADIIRVENGTLNSLDDVVLFTPYDIYYNTPEFVNAVYNLYNLDSLKSQANKATSMFEVKLLLLNASVHAHDKMKLIGAERPLEIMSFVTNPTDRNSTMEKLALFVEQNLSAPLKYATTGYLIAKEMLNQIIPANGNIVINNDENCTTIASSDFAALFIAWRSLLAHKSFAYLKAPYDQNNFSRAKLFFHATAVHWCSEIPEDIPLSFPTLNYFSDIFQCSNNSFTTTECSPPPLINSKDLLDVSTEESGEDANKDDDDLYVSTFRPPTTTASHYTAFFVRTTTPTPYTSRSPITRFATRRPITVNKQVTIVKKPGSLKSINTHSSESAVKLPLPLGKLAGNETRPVIFNLNITIISNTGNVELRIVQ